MSQNTVYKDGFVYVFLDDRIWAIVASTDRVELGHDPEYGRYLQDLDCPARYVMRDNERRA